MSTQANTTTMPRYLRENFTRACSISISGLAFEFFGKQFLGPHGYHFVLGLDALTDKPAITERCFQLDFAPLKFLVAFYQVNPGSAVKANHGIAGDIHTGLGFSWQEQESGDSRPGCQVKGIGLHQEQVSSPLHLGINRWGGLKKFRWQGFGLISQS